MPTREPGESIRMVEDVLGCKWTVQILGAIASGARRPGRLRRSVPGLSTKVMNERLQKLVGYGVLERRAVSVAPLHVEYHLTPKGRQLATLITRILSFCARWDETGRPAGRATTAGGRPGGAMPDASG